MYQVPEKTVVVLLMWWLEGQ